MAAFAQFASDMDASTRAFGERARLTELLKKIQPDACGRTGCRLFAGVKGYLDKIAVGDVGRFEAALITRSNNQALLDTIREESPSDATSESLSEAIEAFAKSFQ